MKAIVYASYGPPEVLRVSNVETPTTKNNEVLIRVRAAAVTTTDVNLRGGDKFMRLAFGLSKPKRTVLGTEFAGEVEATGKDVHRFARVIRCTGQPVGDSVRMPSSSVCPGTDLWRTSRPTSATSKPLPSVKDA